MAFVLKDRVMELSTTTGSGSLTLAGAYTTGFRTFSSVMSNADTTRVFVEAVDANSNASGDWFVGPATYSSGTLTLGTLEASSTGSAITWAAGNKRVVMDASAAYLASLTSSVGEASNAEVWAATETTKIITARRRLASSVEVALTDGATITPDLSTGINFGVTLGGNRTLANPTNSASGMSGLIYVTQDGTGSRTLSYGGNWKFAGGTPTLSNTAGAIDVIAYNVRPSGLVMATISKAFA